MPAATLIPPALLEKPGKILFITHLAIGDFAYLHNCLEALANARPQLELHVWVDEVRRTRNPAKWDALKKYSLYDWLAACPFIKKVYNQTYSPRLFKKSLAEARAQNYGIVVSLANVRPQKYARLARCISPAGFVAGIEKPPSLFTLHHRFAYKKLDAALPFRPAGANNTAHISEIHARRFALLFGIEVPPENRLPKIEISEKWTAFAARHMQGWPGDNNNRPLVFVNIVAKNKKRCWPLASAMELIKNMRQMPAWADARFLLNAMPGDLGSFREAIKQSGLDNVRPFSATENFFQLPAIMKLASLVITVDTATMHLAGILRVPMIALMRQKNPEWKPLDISPAAIVTSPAKNGWIKSISVDQVMTAIKTTRQTATRDESIRH